MVAKNREEQHGGQRHRDKPGKRTRYRDVDDEQVEQDSDERERHDTPLLHLRGGGDREEPEERQRR
ncbi:MAG: hypothetical protein ACOXZ7_05130 [Sphaerochaeta sp.]